MTNQRRSLLQIKILILLDRESVNTITEIAAKIETQRPSVSRSLKNLKAQKLVTRGKRSWQLTKLGKSEASKARKDIAELKERFVDSIGSLTDVLIENKNFSSILDNIKPSFQLANPLSQISKAMEFSPIFEQLTETLRISLPIFDLQNSLVLPIRESVLKPLYDLQGDLSDTFRTLSEGITSPVLETLINQNNLFISNSIANISFLQLDEKLNKFNWLASDLANLSQSFSALEEGQAKQFASYLDMVEAAETAQTKQVASYLDMVEAAETAQTKQVASYLDMVQAAETAQAMLLPASTFSLYTDSARYLVNAETDTRAPITSDHYDISGDKGLDDLLYRLNPNFVDMRRGTWNAISQGGPDSLRHAAVSQRELLRQVLEHLVPSNSLPDEQRHGPQLKARLREILELQQDEANFIEKMANALVSFNTQLNNYTHGNKKRQQILVALLHTGEGLIRYIMVQNTKNNE
jgi:DNA-binding MarR family transcriptional regulator